MGRRALALVSGNAAAALCLMLRTLLFAGLVSASDYGVAASFVMAVAAVEMATQLGLQQMIVQDRREDPALQAGLQGLQAFRGLLGALALLALARPAAAFLGQPDLAWAYGALALVPLAQGLQHLDLWRFGREMRFGRLLAATTLPALLSLLAVWPLVLVFGDWRAMLAALLLHWGGQLVMSHLLAERPWRLAVSRAVLGRALRFGAPLLLNGVLLFLVFHGEKLIVARMLGLEALGTLALAVTLTLTPTLVAARSGQAYFLPRLSAARETPRLFARRAEAALEAGIAAGVLLALGVGLLGSAVAALFEESFPGLGPLLAWAAVQQGLRVFKAGCSDIALARGETGHPVRANLLRILALPAAILAAAGGAGLTVIVGIAALGEAAALALALRLTARSVDLRPLRRPLALGLATLALTPLWPAAWLGTLALTAAGLATLATLAALRAELGLVRPRPSVDRAAAA